MKRSKNVHIMRMNLILILLSMVSNFVNVIFCNYYFGRIRNQPLSVIITTPNLLTPGAFSKLSAIDKQISRKSKGTIEMGDGVVRNPLSPLTIDTACK